MLGVILWTGASAQTKEHFHVHFDKDIYLPGETAWFTVYVFHNSKPSSSTNLYAGVYNAKGNLIEEKRYPIFGGVANGSFAIPDSFPGTAMQLRLFTKKMYLTDSSNAYTRQVEIYQRSQATQIKVIDTASLSVFTEGGHLVAGVVNYINIRGQSPANFSDGITGVALLEDSATLVDSAYFNKDGFTQLQFIPKADKTYWVQWKSCKALLPNAQVNSASLHTEKSGNKIYYNIQRNAVIPRLDNMRIEIRDAEDIIYSETISLKEKIKFTNSIPSDSFPPGILTIHLLDAENNLLQEKYLLIQQKMPAPSIKIAAYSNLPKGKNKIEVDMNDSTQYLLSISVTDENFMRQDNIASITDELLAGSTTAYLANNLQDNKATDIFLQTQSKGLLQKDMQVTDNYLSVEFDHTVKRQLQGKPIISMIVADNIYGKQFFSIQKNDENNFLQQGIVFFDSATIYYRLNTKENGVHFKPDKQEIFVHPKKINPLAVTANQASVITRKILNDSMLLRYETNVRSGITAIKTMENVIVKSKYENPVTKRMAEIDEKYSTGMYRGLARGVQFNLIDDPRADFFPDIYSYLANKIPSVRVERVKISIGGKDSVYAKTFVSVRGGGQEKLVLTLLIDEMESSFDMLESIPVSQIAYVKAVTGVFIGSSFVTNAGAIMIYTKKWDDFPAKVAGMSMHSTKVKGYDTPVTFNTVNYDKNDPSGIADYRTVLYWNPYVVTSASNKKITIEYFNNDLCKKPVLVIKGVNNQGQVFEIRRSIE